MLMMSANSCTGNFIHLRGVSRLSMPSAISTGVVVSVSSAVPMTTSTMRSVIKPARSRPTFVISIIHHFASTVPSLLNKICNTEENITKNMMALMLRSTFMKGTRATSVVSSMNANAAAKPRK